MYERNRDRSFAYGRGNTLYIAAAHISGSKNSRQCCLQQAGPAAERPVRVVQFLRRQIGAGLDEAFAIERNSSRITILVSHRFSTVRMADLIVVLDGARLVEVGTHDELMAKSGQYSELYRIQAAAYR